MRSFTQQLHLYYRDHSNKVSRYTHFVATLLLTFASMIVLSWVKIAVIGAFETSLMWIVCAILLLYYLLLNLSTAILTGLIFGGIAYLVSLLTQYGPEPHAAWLFAGCFIVGWLLHFFTYLLAHKPSGVPDNIQRLLLGPLFVVAELLFLFGYNKKLQQRASSLPRKKITRQ